MSSNKKDKKSKASQLWDFLCGNNKKPTTFEVFACLQKGAIARAKADDLHKEINRIKNKTQKVETILGKLALAKPNSFEEKRLVIELDSVLKRY